MKHLPPSHYKFIAVKFSCSTDNFVDKIYTIYIYTHIRWKSSFFYILCSLCSSLLVHQTFRNFHSLYNILHISNIFDAINEINRACLYNDLFLCAHFFPINHLSTPDVQFTNNLSSSIFTILRFFKKSHIVLSLNIYNTAIVL